MDDAITQLAQRLVKLEGPLNREALMALREEDFFACDMGKQRQDEPWRSMYI